MGIIARKIEEKSQKYVVIEDKIWESLSVGLWINIAKLGTQSYMIITNQLGNRSFNKMAGLNPNCSGLGKEWREHAEIDRNIDNSFNNLNLEENISRKRIWDLFWIFLLKFYKVLCGQFMRKLISWRVDLLGNIDGPF